MTSLIYETITLRKTKEDIRDDFDAHRTLRPLDVLCKHGLSLYGLRDPVPTHHYLVGPVYVTHSANPSTREVKTTLHSQKDLLPSKLVQAISHEYPDCNPEITTTEVTLCKSKSI